RKVGCMWGRIILAVNPAMLSLITLRRGRSRWLPTPPIHGHQKGRSSRPQGLRPRQRRTEGLVSRVVHLLPNRLSPSKIKTAVNDPAAITLTTFGLTGLPI